jgi:methylmalonyl-CoA/ethylmalonyl-CoA epimerase
MLATPPFSKLDHIGVIVRDVDQAVAHYQALGAGSFETVKLAYRERTLRGKPIDPASITLAVRMGTLGSVAIELIQPVEGEGLWKTFLETKGEGIHHLAFCVDDIEKETATLEQKGFTVLYSSRFKHGGGAAYFDIDKVGEVIIELVKWPPKELA